MTIGQFDALLKRKKEHDNKLQFNAGLIAAAVYNAAPFGDEKREVMSPLDFVPEWKKRDEDDKHDLTKMSPEEQKTYLLNMFGKCLIRK